VTLFACCLPAILPVEQLIDNTELTPEETAGTILLQCLSISNVVADGIGDHL
jgi:hypothetical protein